MMGIMLDWHPCTRTPDGGCLAGGFFFTGVTCAACPRGTRFRDGCLFCSLLGGFFLRFFWRCLADNTESLSLLHLLRLSGVFCTDVFFPHFVSSFSMCKLFFHFNIFSHPHTSGTKQLHLSLAPPRSRSSSWISRSASSCCCMC